MVCVSSFFLPLQSRASLLPPFLLSRYANMFHFKILMIFKVLLLTNLLIYSLCSRHPWWLKQLPTTEKKEPPNYRDGAPLTSKHLLLLLWLEAVRSWRAAGRPASKTKPADSKEKSGPSDCCGVNRAAPLPCSESAPYMASAVKALRARTPNKFFTRTSVYESVDITRLHIFVKVPVLCLEPSCTRFPCKHRKPNALS